MDGDTSAVRNACAHHQRYWNRKNPVKLKLPNKKSPKWHNPVEIEEMKDRAFGILTILKYLMSYIAPQSRWTDRLEALFISHPNVDRKLLGSGLSIKDLHGVLPDRKGVKSSNPEILDGRVVLIGFRNNRRSNTYRSLSSLEFSDLELYGHV